MDDTFGFFTEGGGGSGGGGSGGTGAATDAAARITAGAAAAVLAAHPSESDVECQRNSEALVQQWPIDPSLLAAADDVYLLSLAFRQLDAATDAPLPDTWWLEPDPHGQLNLAAQKRNKHDVVRLPITSTADGSWMDTARGSPPASDTFDSLRQLLDTHIGNIPKRNLVELPIECSVDAHAPLAEVAATAPQVAAARDLHLLKSLLQRGVLQPVPFQADLAHVDAYWVPNHDDRVLCYYPKLRKWFAVLPFRSSIVLCDSLATFIAELSSLRARQPTTTRRAIQAFV